MTFTPSAFAQRYDNRQKRIVAPWFRPLNSKVKLKSTDSGSFEIKDVQKLWSEKILPELSKQNLRVELVDSHLSTSIGTRKPGF